MAVMGWNLSSFVHHSAFHTFPILNLLDINKTLCTGHWFPVYHLLIVLFCKMK